MVFFGELSDLQRDTQYTYGECRTLNEQDWAGQNSFGLACERSVSSDCLFPKFKNISKGSRNSGWKTIRRSGLIASCQNVFTYFKAVLTQFQNISEIRALIVPCSPLGITADHAQLYKVWAKFSRSRSVHGTVVFLNMPLSPRFFCSTSVNVLYLKYLNQLLDFITSVMRHCRTQL